MFIIMKEIEKKIIMMKLNDECEIELRYKGEKKGVNSLIKHRSLLSLLSLLLLLLSSSLSL